MTLNIRKLLLRLTTYKKRQADKNDRVHDHTYDAYGHIHGVVDPAIFTTERGIWAVKWSFWGLAVTAAFQVWISMISGSIALLADTIHNVGDALTAIPLWFAFMLAQAGQIALNLFVDVDNPMVLDALNKAYGLGTEIGVILPFSRKHELEADRIGVGLMDKAGYNPNGAIEFWKRMKQGRKGEQPLVYLSTHPVDDKRITEIEKILQNQKKQR